MLHGQIFDLRIPESIRWNHWKRWTLGSDAFLTRDNLNIELVVCSPFGDPKLWLDVLEAAGYDVLVEPYHCEEIKRVVEAAAAGR
jgi:hypothetical protein